MAKARPEDFDDQPPEQGAEREEYLSRLEELEREAAAGLEESPSIDSVRRPMDMPEVLRERAGSGSAPGARNYGGASSEALAKVWTIGLDFAMMVVAGGVLGWLVDRYLVKGGHWGLLSGFLVGLVVGMTRFIREGLAANRRSLQELRNRRGQA